MSSLLHIFVITKFIITDKNTTTKMIVTVFTKDDCIFCDLVKNYLNGKKIDFILKSDGEYDRTLLMEHSGSRSFPQIFIGVKGEDKKFIGGYDDVRNLGLHNVTYHRLLEITGDVIEPMTIEEKEFDRFILFDGQKELEYTDVFTLYKKELSSFWTVEEVDLNGDLVHWDKSTSDEQHFIKLILCFFASLDEVVMENIGINFTQEIKNPIVLLHFAAQNLFESIHSEMYSILIQTYVKDPVEKKKIMKAAQTMPIINKKIKWVTKWMDPKTTSLAERLVSFLALEGIQFSGAFCAIYFFKKMGKFPGLCFANSLIARDETLHAEGGVMLYKHLKHKLGQERINEIIRGAVDIEKEFIKEALPVRLIGMNEESMSEYIEFVADFWTDKLGYSKIYNTKNPYPWMEMQGLEGKTNFFEGRVTEYSKAGVMVDEEEQGFNLDTEF